MQEPNINAATQAVTATSSAGGMLAQARERKGLTREAVAERLNLLMSQVVALEEDNFARFPGETFVRGHLRSYARLLDLDERTVLGAYGCAVATSPVSIQDHVKWRPVSLEQKVSYWRRYSGLVAVFVVLVALWSWQQHREKVQRLSLTAEGGAEQEFAGGIDSALNSGAESALFDSVQLLPNSEERSPAASTVADHAGSTADTQVQTTEEVDKLSLRFSADCWIEIKDRDNKLIVATLKHTDEKLQVEGRGPFKVLLGYAPGVSMAYNGAPVKVDVSEGTRSTRLIVGNS